MATDFAALGISVDTGDLKRAKKDLEDLGKESKKTEKEVQDLGKESKKTGKEVDNLGTEFKKTKKDTDDLGKSIDKTGKETDDLGRSFKKTGKESNNLKDLFKKTGDSAKKLGNDTEKLSKKNKSLRKSYSSLKSTLATLGLVALARKTITATSTIQDLDVRLKSLTKVTGDYNKVQEFLSKTSNTQHKSIVTLSDSYARLRVLQNSGIITGVQTQDILIGLNDAASALGASNAQLGQVFFGLAQGLSSPKLKAEELNQVMEPLPGLLQSMDKASNLAAGGFRRLVLEGKVTSELFATTLIKALKDFEGQSALTGDNVSAKITDIENSWFRLVTTLEEEGTTKGVFNFILEGADTALKSIEFISGGLIRTLKVLAVTATTVGTAFGIYQIALNASIIKTTAMTLATRGLTAVLAINPLTGLITSLGILIGLLVTASDEIEGFASKSLDFKITDTKQRITAQESRIETAEGSVGFLISEDQLRKEKTALLLLNSELNSYQKELKKVQAAAKGAKPAVKGVTKELTEQEKSFNKVILSLEDEQARLRMTAREYEITTLAAKGFTGQQIQAAIKIWDFNKALKDQQAQAKKDKVDLVNLEKAQSDYNRALEDLNSFGDFDDLFPSISKESLRIFELYGDKLEPTTKEIEALTEAVREQKKVMDEWSGLLSGTFSQLLSDGDSFTKNLADMFDSMIDRMLQSALKFASDNIIQGLFAKGGINWGQSLFGAAVGAAAIGVSYLLSDDEPTRKTFAPSRTQTSGDDRALGFSDMVDVDRTSRKVASDTIYAQELIAFRQLNLNISKASSNFIHKLTSVSGETTDVVTDVFSSVFPKTSEFFTGLSNQLSDFGNSIVNSSSLLGGLSDTIDGVADVTKLATDALSIGFGELTDSIGLTTTAALEAELATLAPIDTTSGALAQEGIDIGGSASNASAVSAATKTIGAVVGVLTAAYEVYTLVSGWNELTTGGKIVGVIGAVAAIGAAVVGIGYAAGLIGAAVASAATVVGIVVAAGLLIASFFVGSKKKSDPKVSLSTSTSGIGSDISRTSRLGVVEANIQHLDGKDRRKLESALDANIKNIVAVDNIIADALIEVDKVTGDDTIGLFKSSGASFFQKGKLKSIDFAEMINNRMNWLANNLALTGTPAGIAFNAWFDFFDRAFGSENSLGIAVNVANSLGSLMELPLELIGLLNNNIKSFRLGGTPEDAVKEIESILLTFATLKAGFELLGADNISDKNIVSFLARLNNVGFAVDEAGASLLLYAQILEESGLNISYGINQLFKFADDSNFDKRQYSAFFSVVGSFASLGKSLGLSAEGFSDFVGISNIVSDLASSTLDSAKYDSLQDQAVKYGGLTVTEARAEIESLGIALGDAILEVVNNVVFLNNAIEISGNSFASMGKSLLETVEFSQELVETMGGLEKAEDKWSSFIDAMYSDIEKANTRYIQTARNANLLLDSIGLGGLAFDEFRVAFDDALPRLSAQDVNNWVDTGIAIGAANDAMAAASDLIASQFEEINNAASQRYENELQYINQINDYVEGLLVNEALSPLTNKERLVETQSQFAVQLSAAKAGDPEALSDVTNFANKYLTEARNFYASGDAYQNIFDSVTSSLLGVTDSLGVADTDPLHVIDNTIKEQTLALIESSSLDTAIIIDALERVFSYEQLDSFGLIPTEAELQTSSDTDFINSLFQDAFGFLPDEFNFDLWMDKLISGESRLLVSSQFQTLQDPFKDIPKYADGGFHSGGLAVVGENGAELVNFSRPSQIYTSSQTSDILGGNGESSKELVDLIKQLIEENRELTESLIEATYDSSEQNAESINTNASKRMPTKMELA